MFIGFTVFCMGKVQAGRNCTRFHASGKTLLGASTYSDGECFVHEEIISASRSKSGACGICLEQSTSGFRTPRTPQTPRTPRTQPRSAPLSICLETCMFPAFWESYCLLLSEWRPAENGKHALQSSQVTTTSQEAENVDDSQTVSEVA